MKENLTFEPVWASPPGETVRQILSDRQIAFGDLSAQVDLSIDEIDELIEGQRPIDDLLAEHLALALGPSKSFWLKREKAYRDAHCSSLELIGDQRTNFIQSLPLRDMKAFGWLSDLGDVSPKEAAERFFDDEWGDWRRNGRDLTAAVAFRTSNVHASNAASVAAWLRQGVRQAALIDCPPWQPEHLEEAVVRLRPLSRLKDPTKFFPELVEICRLAGVAVVFVRTPTGCRASGATHFAPNGTPIIQLSFRYRSDDHLWFTIFHEIAHLLLHRDSPIFVEGEDYVSSDEEDEANSYSAEVLVPKAHRDELQTLGRDFKKVMRFAKRIGVSAGIVVGQMQKAGFIRHDQMNFLKTRYDWGQLQHLTP